MRTPVTLSCRRLASLVVTCLLSACSRQRQEASSNSDSAAAAAIIAPAPGATPVPAPTLGFSSPGSVRYDADLDVFFVANINGNPSDKDNNGFISRIDATHPGTAVTFIQAGQNGVTLHAPKGILIIGDTLWVTDIDVVRGFHKRTGAPVATINLARLKATFLNDIAADPDGTLYITDTGISYDAQGTVTQAHVGRIFSVKGRVASVVMEDDHLARPNGIAWDNANRRFILAPSASNGIQSWRVGQSRVAQIAIGAGGFDGIEALPDGRFLITSWTDRSLGVGSDGSGIVRIAGGIDTPGDIGIDPTRGWIAVPRLDANRVDWFALPK